MKIVFTGGGSMGHFYPIIAVAEEINRIARERKLLNPKLYYMGPEPYDTRALYENDIVFTPSTAGKMRRYFSLHNLADLVKTAFGIFRSIWQIYRIYPDVLFSKGGYASFPPLVAARILRIPVVIHESDVAPGRVNAWAGKFAKRVAISYPETTQYFEAGRTALVGNPVRHDLHTIAREGGKEFLELDRNTPTILVLGGSQGAQRINDVMLDILPRLVTSYQIIHQTGKQNLDEVKRTADFILKDNEYKNRYHAFGFLNILALRMAAGAASLVISRAGSGAIFETAMWSLPALFIPIPEDISHDQRKNAYAYARRGGANVIEEKNLTPNLLLYEIERLLKDQDLQERMRAAAARFKTPRAAQAIADVLIEIALSHE